MNVLANLKTAWRSYSQEIRYRPTHKGKAEALITVSAMAGVVYVLLTGLILRQYYDHVLSVSYILVLYFCMPYRRKTLQRSHVACIVLIVWAGTLILFTETHFWQIIYACALIIIPALAYIIIPYRRITAG
ncbi:MAG: hypothetical protein C4532_19085 [Candidatus Abyssobacteria bacterium SURF_17]|uniref:Uncharacterized protein n=1 Tax=Candidatus Abyssobacteria bacterium SURF_17 TaxID=2093361 RepID=A0A419EP95_9BACT|nr:MAG: hypothetical protein C4532_19085 [Candidatus Abyssubacteria bacterium SURF_17]